MVVLTLGGQTGGGARLLGPLVAQALDADYVDRLILQAVAHDLLGGIVLAGAGDAITVAGFQDVDPDTLA